ncbi:hypothetical protein HMPREF2534_01395 [Bacteroides thetaiotaomicron]|nr:hypothetical protein HMPREF2534_01395 [Bacteroides thetaiotaomicron]
MQSITDLSSFTIRYSYYHPVLLFIIRYSYLSKRPLLLVVSYKGMKCFTMMKL